MKLVVVTRQELGWQAATWPLDAAVSKGSVGVLLSADAGQWLSRFMLHWAGKGRLFAESPPSFHRKPVSAFSAWDPLELLALGRPSLGAYPLKALVLSTEQWEALAEEADPAIKASLTLSQEDIRWLEQARELSHEICTDLAERALVAAGMEASISLPLARQFEGLALDPKTLLNYVSQARTTSQGRRDLAAFHALGRLLATDADAPLARGYRWLDTGLA